VVAFVEGELYLVIDVIVSYPVYYLLLLALLSFDLFSFVLQRKKLMDTVLAW
jgi:hypothetical protein